MFSAESLERATRRLGHRGPDRQSTWWSPGERVGLGHARLSIIDLVTGDQPIANETGQLRIIVNGELYDHVRIRRALAGRGHAFTTRTDSEIALHLYEDHGLEFLQHLRGEFALVLWDGAQRQLIAARDRFGIKPLYYAVRDGVLCLASEIKAILATGHPAAWDHECVYQHLLFGQQSDRTLFAGIRQVPAGCYLVARDGAVEVKPYWDLDYPRLGDGDPARSDGSLIEELRAALEEAVRLRLVADVPVGMYLSGGVDSSAVFGIASRATPQPIHAFTVSFSDDPAYDERAVAQHTAEQFGAVFRPIRLGQDDFAEHLEQTVWHGETIGLNGNGVARYLQSRAVHDAGYRVVLSGDGGDELFAGYVQFRIEQLLHSTGGADEQQRIERLSERLNELRARNPHDFSNVLLPGFLGRTLPSIRQALGFTPVWMQGVAASRAPLRTILARDFAEQFASHDLHGAILGQFDVPGQLAGRDPVLQALYLNVRAYFPNHLLYAERLDMSHGVEVRPPLLDHKLFEVARRLPVSVLIRGMQEKYALREAARPYLTSSVYERGKQPFVAPQSTLHPGSRLHQLIRDTVHGTGFQAIPFFDQAALIGLLDRVPEMAHGQRLQLDAGLMLVLTTSMLQRRFIEQAGQP